MHLKIFSCWRISTAASATPEDDSGTPKAAGNRDTDAKKLQEMESQEVPRERGSQWLQFTAAVSACLGVMACGGHLGWTSPALPYLTGPDSEFPVTKGEGAWVASLYTLGGILASFISGACVDRLGRKFSLLAFALPQLAGWGLVVAAKSVITLYVARFVAGIGHGGIYNVAVIYLGEIADKNIRGALGTFLKMSTNVGTLFVTAVGAYLPYWQLNLVSMVVPLTFVATFVFMPETPYFFLIKGRDADAERALMRLRRVVKPESVRADVASMKEAVIEGQRSTRNALFELVGTRGNRRALLILLGLKATQQFSGHMAIVAYTQEIFSHSGSALAPSEAVIVLGGAQLVAGVIAAGLVDRLGRRPLMMASGITAALALGVEGLFFYLKYEAQADVSSFTWLPIVALITYEVMVALGIGTLPYVLLGELFPTNVKGPAVACGIIVGSFFAFIVGLGYQSLNSVAGIHTTFWIFSVCCAAGTLFVFWISPETKGKTLEEIQRELNPPAKILPGP
ncbi:facilitated trehalose transporter Tret1 [Neodiprion lecontei]|uniref:Facilitated trehalose transporter Tret1 n=1 Tax=Neodiprion lecontei TaxID=441921 RepID=A0A6J0B431_NEOLC|nr:facilitated trehalose transporter Tret1 [Neodiprion lecontei]